MRLCLFELRVESLEPLVLLRPAFALRCGITTLREKLLRAFPHDQVGALVRPRLADLTREAHPGMRVNDLAWLQSDDTLLVNARWLPTGTVSLPARGSCVGVIDEELVFARITRQELAGVSLDHLAEAAHQWLARLPRVDAPGRLLTFPWDLVEANSEALVQDLAYRPRPSAVPTLSVVGSPKDVWIDPRATVEPLVVADTTRGPVVIDRGAVVTAFTRLEGPCWVGPDTQVFGAKIRGASLGPQCRIGGEVESAIVHSYTNKYHDGFLGHAYVGSWVNLGAGTQNSDLRNDYREVTLIHNGLPMRTGLTKVGCFLGDHVKTGLGTLLNTGTSIGAFCMLLPSGGFAPKYLPPFTSWWNATLQEAFTVDQLLATAEAAMPRRGVNLTEAQRRLVHAAHEATFDERTRILRERQLRRTRRAA